MASVSSRSPPAPAVRRGPPAVPLHPGPPGRQHDVRQAELIDSLGAPTPPTPAHSGGAPGSRQNRHLMTVASQQHGRGQTTQARAQTVSPPSCTSGYRLRYPVASARAVLSLQARWCSIAAQLLPARDGRGPAYRRTSPISTAHSTSVSAPRLSQVTPVGAEGQAEHRRRPPGWRAADEGAPQHGLERLVAEAADGVLDGRAEPFGSRRRLCHASSRQRRPISGLAPAGRARRRSGSAVLTARRSAPGPAGRAQQGRGGPVPPECSSLIRSSQVPTGGAASRCRTRRAPGRRTRPPAAG